MATTLIRGSQIRGASIGASKFDITVIGGDGKLVASLLPASIAGAMVYQGVFDASIDAAPVAADASNQGHYYIISVAGNGLEIGDWLVSSGVSWDKIDNTEAANAAISTAYDGTASGLVATTVQDAMDEVAARVATAETEIGDLTTLTTTEKTSLAGAVNELAAQAPSVAYVRETLAYTGTTEYLPSQIDALDASNAVIAATLSVYLNGVLQEPGVDYWMNASTITFVEVPDAEDKVHVTYFKR